MLRLIPQTTIAPARPPLGLVLVIDSSGSMNGAKLEQAVGAAHRLINDERLEPDDKMAVIHFGQEAGVLLPLAPLWSKGEAHRALDTLRKGSGSTYMAKGLESALKELSSLLPHTAKRVVLLTDGQAHDQPDCLTLVGRFGESNIPIIAIGIGEAYNENLLMEVAQVSQGRPYHLQEIGQFSGILNTELGSLVREVVTDLRLHINTARGVEIRSLSRVYPSLSEIIPLQPYRLGNIAAGDYTVFVLELEVSEIARPPSRVRLAELMLSGHVPGMEMYRELQAQGLYISFTTDEAAIAAVDPEVLGYVQQKNVDTMVRKAVQLAGKDPSLARHTLQSAVGITRQIGNSRVTQMLQGAIEELEKSGTISEETRKTVSLGGRTKTIKTSSATTEAVPTEEEIRRLTGA